MYAVHATGCPFHKLCWWSQLFAAVKRYRLLCPRCYLTVNRRHYGREELHFYSFAAAFDTALVMPSVFSTTPDVSFQVGAVFVSCCPANLLTHFLSPDPDCCCCLCY